MKKLLLLIIVGLFLLSFTSALDELPIAKLNQEYDIIQTCATCTYVNISVKNLDGFILNNVIMSDNGSGVWTYNFTPTTLGRYDVIGKGDLSGVDTSFATYFEVTQTGDSSNNSQGLMIIGQLGLIGLFVAMAFGFSKEKWKIRTFFFMCALFMGVIVFNSLRVLAGSSSTLSTMADVGLILSIVVLSFMFLYILIYYTIEVFKYFKNKRNMKWEVSQQ